MPALHDGRWWASDFFRYGVFTYDADGREERVLHEEARKAANEAVLLATTVDVPHAGLP